MRIEKMGKLIWVQRAASLPSIFATLFYEAVRFLDFKNDKALPAARGPLDHRQKHHRQLGP